MGVLAKKDTVQEKYENLKNILKEMGSVLVAFSGGVDSTFLLKAACDVCGDRVLAVTADSPNRHRTEIVRAKALAQRIRARHKIVLTDELRVPEVANNDQERCYHCKKYIFGKLCEMARGDQLDFIADGSQFDDRNGYRPGLKAMEELGVRSPLKEAGLFKRDIRMLSKELNLPTWDMPSQSCLLTRFPYGEPIDAEKLARVEAAEEFLAKLGFVQNRVRVYQDTARIEVAPSMTGRITEQEISSQILDKFKSLGFRYITVDLAGYRFGSMDET